MVVIEFNVPLKSKTEILTIGDLIKGVKMRDETTNIDLNPVYQRDVVWSDQKMGSFIDSLMKGYVPSNITMSKNDGKWICIDGKQRITSIIKFNDNEVPWVFVDEDGEDKYVYFSNVPDTKKDSQSCCKLTKEQQKVFLEKTITLVVYKNLDYVTQCDIFNRIQNSMSATSGEQSFSLFKNATVASKLKELCRNLDYTHKARYRNLDIVMNIMYMKSSGKVRTLSGRKEKLTFIEFLDQEKKYDKIVEPLVDPMNVFFGDDIMGHEKLLKEKMTKNFVIVMFYMLTTEKKKLVDYDSNDFRDVRKMLTEIWRSWSVIDGEVNKDRSKMSTKILQQIQELYEKNSEKYFKEDDEDNDDEDSENNSDNSDNSDNDNSDDETDDDSFVPNQKIVKKTKDESQQSTRKIFKKMN